MCDHYDNYFPEEIKSQKGLYEQLKNSQEFTPSEELDNKGITEIFNELKKLPFWNLKIRLSENKTQIIFEE